MFTRLSKRWLVISCFAVAASSLTNAQEITSAGRAFDTPSSKRESIVGSNVQVSAERRNDGHFETLLAADPKNSAHLLATSIVFSERKNTNEVVAYVSLDEGKTWALTLTASPEQNVCCFVDPAVAFGPDGIAYLIFYGPTPEMKYYAYLYRSRDGGRTWLAPTKMPVVDRNFIAMDDTGGKYNRRVYIEGILGLRTIDASPQVPTAFLVYHSKDGGVTFEPPAQLVSAPDHAVLDNAPGVVLSDGTLVCLFGELTSRRTDMDPFPEARPSKPNARLKVVTSSDGGETFTKSVIVSEYAIPWTWNTTMVPYLAVDRSGGPFHDRLYAVYPDLRSGRVQILFTYSSDKGKSWSKPAVLNDDWRPLSQVEGPDLFMPVVAVNRDGVVGVMWYDRRESLNNLDWSVRFRASLDGGETFLPSIKVSEAFFAHGKDDRWVVQAWPSGGGHHWLASQYHGGNLKVNASIFWGYANGGDTAGLAAGANGTFHALWVDNRTGVSQVWTSPIRVEGIVLRNGSADLAGLEDISGKVVINYTRTRYDRQTNTLSLDTELENVSEQVLTGPIRVRVISLQSDFGVPKIINTDNGESGVGAVWDFTPLLSEGKLKPKEKPKTRHLEFSLSNLRPISIPSPPKGAVWPPFPLVEVEAKVLGKLEKKTALNGQ